MFECQSEKKQIGIEGNSFGDISCKTREENMCKMCKIMLSCFSKQQQTNSLQFSGERLENQRVNIYLELNVDLLHIESADLPTARERRERKIQLDLDFVYVMMITKKPSNLHRVNLSGIESTLILDILLFSILLGQNYSIFMSKVLYGYLGKIVPYRH